MRTFFLLFFLPAYFELFSQYSTPAQSYAATIESSKIREHVYKLASREFQGRETGTDGNLLASRYIADQFSSFGIAPVPNEDDYFQELDFTSIKWADIRMNVDGQPVEHLRDFLSIPQFFPLKTDAMEINSMTFLGYGIDDSAYSDYKGKKFTGQHLLVYGGEPRNRNGQFRISGSDSLSAWSYDPLLKVAAAKKAGAASIWIIDDKLREQVMFARRYLLTGAMIMGGHND